MYILYFHHIPAKVSLNYCSQPASTRTTLRRIMTDDMPVKY